MNEFVELFIVVAAIILLALLGMGINVIMAGAVYTTFQWIMGPVIALGLSALLFIFQQAAA